MLVIILVDCDDVGSIYTLRYSDADRNPFFSNVSVEILGLGSAAQHFVVVGDQVRTSPSLKDNCNSNYELLIRVKDNGGEFCLINTF